MPDSEVRVSQLLVVASDSIKLIFTGNVVTHSGYSEVSNYFITDLDATGSPAVLSVYPTAKRVSTFVILEVRGLLEPGRYRLVVVDHKLHDSQGLDLVSISATWRMRRTKIDSALLGASRFDKRIGSNIRGILEAVMLSDEEIGGSY